MINHNICNIVHYFIFNPVGIVAVFHDQMLHRSPDYIIIIDYKSSKEDILFFNRSESLDVE